MTWASSSGRGSFALWEGDRARSEEARHHLCLYHRRRRLTERGNSENVVDECMFSSRVTGFLFFLRTHPVVSHPFSWSGVTAASWNQRTFPRSYYPAGVTAPITYCGSHRRRPCGGSLLNSLSLATFLRRTHRCCVSDIGCRRETAYFRFSFEDVSFFREGV